MNARTAIIIGAGPAGLTAAYELIDKTDIKAVIYEMSSALGGISQTVNYKGNRIDIGGHRFFSKSDRVMKWWQNILPLQGAPSKDDLLLGRKVPLSREAEQKKLRSREAEKAPPPDPEKTDQVMLVRNRVSRIFFMRKFFDYPISLSAETLRNLGAVRIAKIGLSYLKVKMSPIRPEKSLEDFFINRFGRELYATFFRDYTEKVWGVPCRQIKPEWGAQRIKGLSVTKTVLHAVKSLLVKDASVAQKKVETSLIEQFTYPKLGPGQMWEEVTRRVTAAGAEMRMNHKVVGLKREGNRIVEARIKNEKTGQVITQTGDYFFSTMPVKELIECMGPDAPDEAHRVAQGLGYRDFVTVGLLLKKLKIKNQTKIPTINDIIPDNWIYIQENDVKVGRLQIFNNWSPYMVRDPKTTWIGMEYFCNEGDEFWSQKDETIAQRGIDELVSIGVIDREAVLDHVVFRMPKAYPAYFGTYDQFDVVKKFTDSIENLFLIGRNGMHKYNNQDHSMLAAITAVENIINGVKTKDNLWKVNAEAEYHEKK